ncbi:PP2C family protein-serine/threonine phosphatase [Microlunatus capsulatus]|uniref:Protein phosphatase n=1 Tax=Microlunatus capsulatus TaxID=99117 RepID=A0ABS4Z8K4_9ACTN|nr:protein phosphatase 2C domain-containing protein [Microlunatus capsulatus]MBP2417382.1 protein phosphatase [Microlunatus capsulatus]
MALTLRYVTHSEIGLVRKNNQDSGYASPNLLLVADGMGGAAAGDLASAVAVEAIRQSDAPTPSAEMLDVLARALHRANDRIADLVEADVSLDGMGTTVTGALFDGRDLGLAHIGDSRAYLYRDGTLERLTHDHSWVQSLVDDGKIDEAEAAVHPHRSLLLKVLNGQPANEPDLTRTTLVAGDRLLFCSDGLCGLVPDPEIAAGLAVPDAAEALRQLVDEALAEGGIDNITAILADVVESDGSTEPVVLGAAADRDLPTAPIGLPGPGSAGPAGTPADPAAPSGPTAHGATAGGATALGAAAPLEDEARYNPQPPARRRLVRPLVGALVLLLVAGAGLAAAFSWTRTQYFVGAAGDQVAIFQGLPDDVVVPLSRVYEVQPLALADLPAFYAQQVQAGIEVSSLTSARQTVAELAEAARRCELTRPTPTPSASPTGKADPRSTPTPVRPEGPATPSASASASGTTGAGC